MIGDWGEWATSQNFGSFFDWTTQNWVDRKALVDQLLQILPPERMLQLRTPDFKMRMYGAATLAPLEAFSGSARARIGQHNDCFLAQNNDYGTYRNTSVEYPWLANESKYLPTGGETCNYVSPRSDCANAMNEMALFHWSYLNLGYSPTVISNWKTQGCFNEIKQKLGYRLTLQSGSYASRARPGGPLAVNLTLQNRGWAAPFNPRAIEVVLRHYYNGTVYRIPVATDPRTWLPGASIVVNLPVTIPGNVPAGDYSVLLRLPDPEPTLRDRPEYAIQFANTNMWEAATGFNNLNHVVRIGTGS
ncbi:MAG: DUF4832 domain-containing protein, partial [Herminiimonas sp.]|nr:DUF4832 domain-containing protein [Herminiimonas sp.]